MMNAYPASERCRKYLIQYSYGNFAYYSIWYTDMSDEAQQDKLLIDNNKRILVFSTVPALMTHIKNTLDILPDSQSFAEWVLANEDKPYTIYNIDEVLVSISQFTRVIDLSQEDALKQIGLFNLIGDYRDLVGDAFLEDKMDSKAMRAFFDSSYNFFFWKTPEDEEDPEIDPETFKSEFTGIIDYFVNKFEVDL